MSAWQIVALSGIAYMALFPLIADGINWLVSRFDRGVDWDLHVDQAIEVTR